VGGEKKKKNYLVLGNSGGDGDLLLGFLLSGNALGLNVDGSDLSEGLVGKLLDALASWTVEGILRCGLSLLGGRLSLFLDVVLGIELSCLGSDSVIDTILFINKLDIFLDAGKIALDDSGNTEFDVIFEALGDDLVLKFVAVGEDLCNNAGDGSRVLGGLWLVGDGVLEVRFNDDVTIVDQGVGEQGTRFGATLTLKVDKGNLMSAIFILLEFKLLDLAAEQEKVLDGLL